MHRVQRTTTQQNLIIKFIANFSRDHFVCVRMSVYEMRRCGHIAYCRLAMCEPRVSARRGQYIWMSRIVESSRAVQCSSIGSSNNRNHKLDITTRNAKLLCVCVCALCCGVEIKRQSHSDHALHWILWYDGKWRRLTGCGMQLTLPAAAATAATAVCCCRQFSCTNKSIRTHFLWHWLWLRLDFAGKSVMANGFK